MKFVLTDYQTDAVADLLGEVEDGWDSYAKRGKLSAVALSAPTAAGKTVIAAGLLELLYNGDEQVTPRPDLTVLWVTDDPSLNEQTRRKILKASTGVHPRQLIKVTNSLDQETLDRGKVYFVHIQQLGKGATSYNEVGNGRQYSLWQTIANTISQRPSDFLIIVDEAHKGTKGTGNGSKTIIKEITDGAGGKLPPAPVVLAITATPDNFIKAMTAAGNRALSQVIVDPARVQASGLIKDKIGLNHPTEAQPGDATLLEMAVEELREFSELWAAYSTQQSEPLVEPILVVQVRAGASDKDLAVILSTLKNSWEVLDGPAVAHAFQEHTTLNVNAQSVRYLAPQDIQDDERVRVVLFKEALTTGWDCPRAEVLVSFRAANDATYIAQLVGRMVRTPLAKRITTDDVLNTVGLYLPYFNEDEVEHIVTHLQGKDSGLTSRIVKQLVSCPRNKAVPASVWTKMAGLPTYTRPSKNFRSDVARVNALAVLLQGHGIKPDAVESARNHIIGTLKLEAQRLGDTLDTQVADYQVLDSQRVLVALDGSGKDTEKRTHATSVRNIDDLFATGRRLLGDAAAKWYWNDLCENGEDPDDAKVRVAALASDSLAVANLQKAAGTLIDSWRTTFNPQITNLPAAQRDSYYTIWQQSKAPQQVTLVMKDQVTASAEDPKYAKHLYKPASTEFPADFNDWEKAVLQAELAKDSLVCWYRNPTGGRDAIGVPYKMSGEAKTMYPDFLFFHKVGDDIVVDLVDPHRPDIGDTGPKWTGLAKYAADHGTEYRSIRAVIVDANDKLVALDLTNADVAEPLSKAANDKDIRKVFSDFGGNY